MPGATLAGYAGGVALLASAGGDLTSPGGLLRHVLLLVGALCAAAAAPTASAAVLACFVVGLGCSLTQRLLACATDVVGPDDRARTIGFVVGGGLCGIVLARAAVPSACLLLGWRGMFALSACLAAACGVRAAMSCARRPSRAVRVAAPLPAALSLWRAEPVLRRAAVQQACVFAAFNLSWAVFPRLLAVEGTPRGLAMGAVASLGAAAALLSGRFCAARGARDVAWLGLAAVGIAAPSLLLARHMLPGCASMGLLEVGTQLALVANQTRAQALASTAAVRGRVTAIVTTIGFAGGAAGAAIGNLLSLGFVNLFRRW